MIPFTKMVQHKRAKMPVLARIFAVLLLVERSACINLTYIVKKEGERFQPNCIADENERYAAIGWVYPLPEKEDQLPEITTKFLPNIPNSYNCKFSKNAKCNSIWALKNWEVDTNSTRTSDLILDSRWEDFPTILTGSGTKEFKDRIEIPSVFRVGLSVRAADSVEILICEGWNPYNYACYHVTITQTKVLLRKYATFPKNIADGDKILDSYEVFANILSGDEWRNFIINLDDNGVISLDDVTANRTVIQYEDKEVLKPLYLLVRSTQPALWKIHQNQFFYTKSPQISRLGPILNLPSKDLCVSLYVSTCPYCAMTFILLYNDQRKILEDVEPTQEFEWRLVKLKAEQILIDKVTIFVETKFTNNVVNKTEGFWAVDDIRVCNEKEIKITFLKMKQDEKTAEEISCQVVQHPKWRPEKLVYSQIKDFPTIESTPDSTAISLNWTQEDPNNRINYFITYQANDICPSEPFNLRRIKSNGFLMTKHNEITIDNLVPYTKYNISFTSMLHEKEMNITVTTLESEKPTPQEIPNKIQIRTTDTHAYISWDKVDCSLIYGPLLYSIQVINYDTNTMQELNVQTENTVEINDLQPFTEYTFKIVTARNFESIQNGTNTITTSYNQTTQPGVAPPVRNLEIYSIDKNSVSLRYDLPKNPKGIPAEVQVTRCNPYMFNKCRTTYFNVTRCKLWLRKYCLEIPHLIPNQQYSFNISIKNKDTHVYSKEIKIDAFTQDHVPAPPTNVTYRVVDCLKDLEYCHLNISWLHPYHQNGTISSFEIFLNCSDNSTTQSMHGILDVSNKTYSPRYQYQFQVVPYSTHYELYVQSVYGTYRSQLANVHIKTDDIGQHVDLSPKREKLTPTSVTYKLPPLDPRLESYTLTTFVQDFDATRDVPSDVLRVRKVKDNLCHNFGNTWILPTVEVTKDSDIEDYVIGSEDNSNKYLQPDTQYCIIFIITNKYKNTEHDVVYIQKLRTLNVKSSDKEASGSDSAKTSSASSYNHLYVLLLLLLLVPIGFLVYRYLKKKRRPLSKYQDTRDNEYESLPFEEREDNSVHNGTYDQLLHK